MEQDSFSLTEGGPAYRLAAHAGLAGRDSKGTIKQAIILFLITWLPLLILASIQGLAFGDAVKVPFLHDFAAYTRFVFAVPLLVIAETLIGSQLSAVIRYFRSAQIIDKTDMPAFNAVVDEAIRLRDSATVEIILILLIVATTAFGLTPELPLNVSTWRIISPENAQKFTLAGIWYTLISISIFKFLWYRWAWRFYIWARLLRKISKLHLQLVPTHPDGAAGLGLVSVGHIMFAILVFIGSSVIASIFMNRLLYEGISVSQLQTQAIAILILSLIVILAPLFAFFPVLVETKRRGLLNYGLLGMDYTKSFQDKWVENKAPQSEEFLGSSDIQSLADFNNSFDIIRKMRLVPFDIPTATTIAIAAVAPLLLALLIITPVGDTTQKIIKLIQAFLG